MGERSRHVVPFVAALAVLARGGTDAAEVEAQRGQPELPAHLGDPDYDWIVHVAAVERVRVADHDTARGGRGKADPRLETGTIARGQRCFVFGYHTAERITGGSSPVQSMC